MLSGMGSGAVDVFRMVSVIIIIFSSDHVILFSWQVNLELL